MNNKKWFLDRIGKRVYRNNIPCCDVCERIYQEGLIIHDEQHAGYLCDIVGEYNYEGTPIQYFDTKEEVEQYEKTLKKEPQ
jgi:hypothetical protein